MHPHFVIVKSDVQTLLNIAYLHKALALFYRLAQWPCTLTTQPVDSSKKHLDGQSAAITPSNMTSRVFNVMG